MIAYKPLQKLILASLTLVMFFAVTNTAIACTSPTASAGNIIYDDDRNLLSYCDGTNWIEVRGSGNLGYQANGILFNGTDTRLTNNSPSGLTNSDKITGSLWLKSTDTFVNFLVSDTFSIAHTNTGRFIISADNALGTEVLSVRSSAGFLDFDDGSWYHVLFSFDLSDVSQNSAHIYINDQDVTNILGWTASEIMDFGGATYLNVAGTGSSYYGTNIADMWVDFGTYIDLDVEANRRDFISAQGRPVSLGLDGSVPTGSAPEIFLSGNISGWATNKGTANGFTEEGTMVSSSDSPSINDPTLIGHWKLDETSGTSAADSSNFVNNGTMINGLDGTDTSPGKVNGSLRFDGTSLNMVSTSLEIDQGGTQSYSFSVWVYPMEATCDGNNNRCMVVSTDNGAHDWSILQENGNWNIFNNVSTVSITPIQLNAWQHLAVNFDHTISQYTFYMNGQEVDSGVIAYDASDNNFAIGENPSGFAEPFNGLIDDVRVYNRVLSEGEIQSLYAACQEGTMIYNADRHVPQYCAGNDQWTAMGPIRDGILNGLVGHWPLDETSGTTASDSSGNLNNGTMLNGLDGSTSSTDGKIGTSLDFDMPSDNRVQINAPSSVLDNIWDGGGTVSFWTYLDSAGQNQSIWVAKENSWVINNRASAPSVGIEFDIDFSGQSNSLWRRDDGIVVGEWTHVVITYNADSVTNNPTLYLNGTQIGLTEITTPVGTREDDAGANIFFGDNPAGTVSQDGRIDDVRFYNRMLSEAEIQALYSLGNNEDSSLVGHWKLDDLSGTSSEDSSGNANTGTLNGFSTPPEWTSSGQINAALSFNGSSTYVEAADSASLDIASTLTLSAWVNPNDCTSDTNGSFPLRTIISKWRNNTDNRSFILGMSPNGSNCRLLFNISDNGLWDDDTTNGVVTTDTIPANTWSLITATYDGNTNTAAIYINATLSISQVITEPTTNIIFNSNAPLRIGASASWGNSPKYFLGRIDDARVYNRVLSTTEIDALHTLGIGNCSNPLGKEGDLIMGDLDAGAGTDNALMYCDGANWQAVGKTP